MTAAHIDAQMATLLRNPRRSFRLDEQTDKALELFCEENERTPSQALRLALKSFIPVQFFKLAAKPIKKAAK